VQRHVPRRFSVLNPTVSVDEARINLIKSRPVLARLAGDAQAGERRWQEAMDALASMRLDYLSAEPDESREPADPRAYVRRLRADEWRLRAGDRRRPLVR
jgi:hypothetical protein